MAEADRTAVPPHEWEALAADPDLHEPPPTTAVVVDDADDIDAGSQAEAGHSPIVELAPDPAAVAEWARAVNDEPAVVATIEWISPPDPVTGDGGVRFHGHVYDDPTT